MLLYLKRWRLLVIALIAAVAVTITTGTQAFANEPGEGNQWNPEYAQGSPVQSQDTMSEAQSPSPENGGTGALVHLWRGYFDNQIWANVDGVNNNALFHIANQTNTNTLVAPRVLYSNGYFYAFQTGVDGQVYWSHAADLFTINGQPSVAFGSSWSFWQVIPGVQTNQSVSAASSPSGILLTWRGVGTDTRLLSAWLQNGSFTFQTAQVMNSPYGTPFQSNSAPVVAYSPRVQRFLTTFRGLADDRVYITAQNLGSSLWGYSQQFPSITTNSSPAIAALPNGAFLVTARDYSNNVWLQTVDQFGAVGGWQQESQHWATSVTPFLSVLGATIYMLLTGLGNGEVYWKPVYQP